MMSARWEWLRSLYALSAQNLKPGPKKALADRSRLKQLLEKKNKDGPSTGRQLSVMRSKRFLSAKPFTTPQPTTSHQPSIIRAPIDLTLSSLNNNFNTIKRRGFGEEYRPVGLMNPNGQKLGAKYLYSRGWNDHQSGSFAIHNGLNVTINQSTDRRRRRRRKGDVETIRE